MNVIFASPNEEAYLKQEETKAKRLERLQQVRRQEKALAMARRQQYKEASGVEWSHVIVDLKTLKDQWSASQQQELEKLEEIERAALEKLGLGMKEASSKEVSKTHEVTAYRKTVIANQTTEDIRFLDSIKENRFEAQQALQPILDKRALQKLIAQREHERALRAAAAYRSKALRGLITNIEIPRNPVGRQQDRSRREFMAFDETCYHRDFVAVKCDPETELVHRVDGWEGAAIAYKAQDERLLALQKKREKIDQNMAERYKNALKGAHMDTQKDILDRELEQILIEDRRRRQLNAGQHAAFFRNLYMEVGEKDLEQRFNTQFRTEEEHIEATTERAPPSSRAKPQSGFPRRPPKPMSPNLSIEFVPANLALQKKS